MPTNKAVKANPRMVHIVLGVIGLPALDIAGEPMKLSMMNRTDNSMKTR